MESYPPLTAHAHARTPSLVHLHVSAHIHAEHSREKLLDLAVPTLSRADAANDMPDITPRLASQPRLLPSPHQTLSRAHGVDHGPRGRKPSARRRK